MRKGLVNTWSEDPELSFQEVDSPLSGIPLTLGEKHLIRHSVAQRQGRRGIFFRLYVTLL